MGLISEQDGCNLKSVRLPIECSFNKKLLGRTVVLCGAGQSDFDG